MNNNREQIPINPAMLIWARETGGFSLDDLITQYPKLSAWEQGSIYPTYGRLEELAKKYHRPIALFFFPEPPKEESIEKSLRAISEDEVINLSPRMRYLFRRAKSLQCKLQELFVGEEERQRKKLDWLNEGHSKTLDELVSRVRNVLGISIEEQIAWKDSGIALKEWRNALAHNGVYVFKEAFKNDNISGFCIYDSLFPVIFINNSHSKNRQIFTVFHELAHLIYHDSFLDVYDRKAFALEATDPAHIEVKCNAFAGQFLLPDTHFSQHLKSINTSESALAELANIYSVSRESILRRFLDKGLVDRNFYFATVNRWAEFLKTQKAKQKEEKNGSGNFYNTHMSYLGDAYLSLVFKKYYQGLFTSEKAAEYLSSPVRGLSTIEEKLMNRETF